MPTTTGLAATIETNQGYPRLYQHKRLHAAVCVYVVEEGQRALTVLYLQEEWHSRKRPGRAPAEPYVEFVR